MPNFPSVIVYSQKDADALYEYRHVHLLAIYTKDP